MVNPYSTCKTLRELIERRTLYEDLAPETRAWYKRIISVYCGWAGCDPPIEEFNGPAISQFLADKQKKGRSSWYVASLRNGLVSLLRIVRGDGPCERVRTIRRSQLDPEAWTPAEVERLLLACNDLPETQRLHWQLVIAVAYYTGLDGCDVRRIEQKDIANDGTIIFRRRKTGKRVNVRIPPELVVIIRERCPRLRPCFNTGVSHEWFRTVFGRIVRKAGLFGTWKKLRKSSGSNVEVIAPGTGHRHLGNTRAIFERHYEAARLTHAESTMPPEIALPATAAS